MHSTRESSLIIENAILINEHEVEEASVRVDGMGRIAQIAPPGGLSRGDGVEQVIDAQGSYLVPGVIDSHVHFREPGLTAKGDLSTESRAAVAGGVTSYFDMPNTLPPTTSNERLREKIGLARGRSHANFAFYLGASTGNLDEIRSIDPSATPGVKLFLGSSTGSMQVADETTLGQIFAESPLLIACHCEDDRAISLAYEVARKKYEDNIPFHYHSVIRSPYACLLSVNHAIELAQAHEARLHILHLSTADEVERVQLYNMLSDGRITCETCPHYLLFNLNDYDALGWRIKCNPSIKTDRDQRALIHALRSPDMIRTLGSDHAPHLANEKDQSYSQSPSGLPSVEFSLRLMFDLADRENLPLTRVVELMSHAPAELFGLTQRGFVREGYYADLVLVRRHEQQRSLLLRGIHSACGWSPYANFLTHYEVTHTIVNGHVAYSAEEGFSPARGQALEFANNTR